ncbi:hypothetical protein [Methylobacterium aerolatum]|uniref:Uncharacterized protein n=1 Tax=Methylobacterium aerolatum TaxID=418708 RepID=A0ABU0HTA6_9HYPH|nr:hypothetical protein [Methylobacterium aerolatum]MDQ0445551.1 hypothetical protein [Methylobacterium aerolatum]GJD36338.1 hypothetical protein FMGBMHLM_3258 [Methylobacterium aerolatum]
MIASRPTLRAAIVAGLAALSIPGTALASDAATTHRTWTDCLGRSYVTGIAYTGRDLAADAAFSACRGEENAYLAALSASPLLDGDDIAQARPELVARARHRLLGMVNSGPRSILR